MCRGLGRSKEVDGNSPVMAESETDLAIVVRYRRQIRAGRHREAREIGGVSRRERRRVMMPGEHYRLKQQREDREDSARSPHIVPSLRPEGRSHCDFTLLGRPNFR